MLYRCIGLYRLNIGGVYVGSLCGCLKMCHFSRRVKTLYKCEPDHESELSFDPGQIITNGWWCPFSYFFHFSFIGAFDRKRRQRKLMQSLHLVYESKEDGWLVGTLNGKTGLIPANYVESLP